MRPAAPILACALWWNCQVSVLTYHNDLARTGQNLSESILTPATVGSGQFGRLFSYTVDGQVYAQPLYVPGVVIPGKGIHNVVFVATEHDSVYAFDADNDLGSPLWHVNFLNPTQGVTTASPADLACSSITPEVGITATPVIDPASGTLYVVSMTEEHPSGNYSQQLHALDITTGREKQNSPVEIQATVPGQGDGDAANIVQFKPWLYKERAGLLLLNGVVYTAWSSQCDSGDYHGWMIGYDASTMQQVSAYADTPNWDGGAFWQGGAAPAADANGNIYVVSANGTFDANAGGSDLGESVIKLSTSKTLAASDYFTPHDADALSDENLDLGSSGALLLPDSAGSAAHPHLLVIGSKSGTVYLVDRDNLGHFQPQADDQIVQTLTNAVAPLFGIPAYFNNNVYFSGTHDQVKMFPIQNGTLSLTPSSASSETYATLGTVPSISANGSAGGILWTIDPNGELHAYDATDLKHELFEGSFGSSVKFSTPTIANGKVYVGTASSLEVFGLLDPNPGAVAAVVDAPGGNVSLFGSNLAAGTATAPGSNWPRILQGVCVFINGVAAPVGYVSPTQINAQVPLGSPPGKATLTVVSSGRVLPQVTFTISAAVPPHPGAR